MIGATLAALALGAVGAVGLRRSMAAPPPREPICGDCKTPGCTGALHFIGVHDKGATV